MSERQLTLWQGCLAVGGILSATSDAAEALAPFRAPNLSPPVAIIGLPVWSVVPETTTFGLTTQIANHYRLSRRAGDALTLDGETVRLRGYLEQPVGRDWSVAVDIPYYHQSGGVLDDVVDGWHTAFGLPDGGRDYRREGLLEFDLANARGSFFQLGQSGSGVGDVQLSVAKRLNAGKSWTLRGTVKLPTGREHLLAGSGAADVSISALQVREVDIRGRAAGYYFGGALVEFGQPDNVFFATEDRLLAAVIGGALTLRPRIGIKGQLDINSAIYATELEEIGQTAVQATIGGWLRFGETALFEYAISEDLNVSTTPDVVVFVNLSWRL